MDVLSDVLRVIRLTGSVFFTADLYAPWSVSSPGGGKLLHYMPDQAECIALFHIISEGSCWFRTYNGKSILLEQGSLVIFPHGSSHSMGSDTSSMGSDTSKTPVSVLQLLKKIKGYPDASIEYGGKRTKTQFICGYLLCDQRFNPLLGALPEMLIVSPNMETRIVQCATEENEIRHVTLTLETNSWLDLTLNHLAKEVQDNNVGGATLITRLAELMYVEVLRRYMNSLSLNSKGWLADIRDPEVGAALKLLHNQPGKKWNVEQLVPEVGVSRSAFARRFTDLVGESPILATPG